MFIPRTLAELSDGRPGRAAVSRAIVVAGIVTAALFLILSANITLGQEDLEVGQIAERDIRAPRDVTFDSVSQTRAARDAAAADVPAQTVTAKAPADNLAEQLTAFDSFDRRVSRVLVLRDRGTLSIDETVDRLADDAPEVPITHRTFLAQMAATSWEAVAAEARRVVE
ncbi:MAG: hypothetical protein ACXWWL_06625, partial [Candidatus Limnocylindria bacterium]